MAPDAPFTISAGAIEVEIDPIAGGRLAQVTVDGVTLLVARGDVPDSAIPWGAYPMVPWAGRVRCGRFRFEGIDHQLPLNHGPHAMHGVGFLSSWTTTERSATQARLDLALPDDDRWPFGGRVHQTIAVDPAGLTCSMSVVADDRPFPCSFGWHPWFRKPDRLDFHPTAMYRRDDDHIAVDDLVPVPPGPWDDCFINREPVGLTVDGVDIVLESTCDHWVVYDQPEHATCVEPQTGPPDAFTIRPEIVAPGRSMTAAFRLKHSPWTLQSRNHES